MHADMYFVETPIALVSLVRKRHIMCGDMIVCQWETGRGASTNGLYFYDGTTLIDQDRTYDSRGTIPFHPIAEFNIGHWDLSGGLSSAFCAFGVDEDGNRVPATEKDVRRIRWCTHAGPISTLVFGPGSRFPEIRLVRVEIFLGGYVGVLEYEDERYLVYGMNFGDKNEPQTHYVSSVVNTATGIPRVSEIVMTHLRKFEVKDANMLIWPELCDVEEI